jgi:hypothetical protein
MMEMPKSNDARSDMLKQKIAINVPDYSNDARSDMLKQKNAIKAPEYYNIYSSPSAVGSETIATTTLSLEGKQQLAGEARSKEGFVENISFSNNDPPNTMNDDISNKSLPNAWKEMNQDPKYDFSGKVTNPYGYGYIPSLDEARNRDSVEMYQQEHATFVMGAITGVSLIVLGILMASN